jgi:hypothetical protein
MSWLYLPPACLPEPETCAASRSAPEPEGSTSGLQSHAPGIALFVTSSGKASLRPPSWRGWKTRPWIAHLCGTTLPPSTVARGVERWISYWADTPAPLSASRAGARGSTIPAIYGHTSPGSSASVDPNGCFWKTSPIISTSVIARSEKSWKAWATALRKDCLRRQKLARRTSDSGCLFWPTPNVARGGNPPEILIRKGNHYVRPSGKKAHLGLDQAARMWPTPMASDGCKPSAGNRKSADLTHVAAMWPTPAARDAKGANSRAHVEVNGTGRRHMDQLANYAVHSLPARKIARDGETTCDQRRSLNPAFVEALMGWPIAWTGFGSVATAWSHWLQRMRSEFLRLGSMPMDEEVEA